MLAHQIPASGAGDYANTGKDFELSSLRHSWRISSTWFFHENCFERSRPTTAIRVEVSGDAATCAKAPASASAENRGKYIAASPQISRCTGISEATTGTPRAIDSTNGCAKVSV